jgi:hypothetical protein
MTQLFRWLSGIAAALVLIQAVLAGQWLGGNAAIIETHGWLGSGTFLLVILLAGASFMGWRQGAFDLKPFGVSAVMLLLVVAQLGLGYAGRSSAVAASLHLPLGVLIFGALVTLFALMLPGRLAPATARVR